MALNNNNNNDCCKCTTPEYEIVLNEQGPQGRQGEKGDAGFTPIISVKDNTPSNYTLNILTQDGQITTPNLKANLPAGGATGQILTKNSGEQDDCSWQNLPASTIETEGIARLATETDFETTEDSEVSDNTIVTPALFNSEFEKQSANFVTTNTEQTITSKKTFISDVTIRDGLILQNSIVNSNKVDNINPNIIKHTPENNDIIIGETQAFTSEYYKNLGIEIQCDNLDNDAGIYTHRDGNRYPLLDSSNVIAGNNITIDKTSTGITINSTGGGGGGDISGTDNTFTGTNTFSGTTVVNSATFKVTVNPNTGASARVFSSYGVSGNTPKIGDTGAKVFLDNTNVGSRVNTAEGTQVDVSIQDLYNRATDTYTIDESDELFDGKENKLTATDPVVISDSIVNPTENMTISETGDIVSNYDSWYYNTQGDQFQYSTNLPSVVVGDKFLDVMKTLGAIFIPFTFGNVYACPAVLATDTNDGQIPPIAIGYYVSDSEFIPVISFNTEAQCMKHTSNVLTHHSGYYSYNEFTREYAYGSYSNPELAEANKPQFGNMYLQVFKTDINTYRYSLARHWSNKLVITSADISNSVYDELSKCTHIMFGARYYNDGYSSHPKYTLSSSLDATNKYNALTNFKEFEFDKDITNLVSSTDEFNFQELMASGDNLIKLEQSVVHTISLNSTVTTQGNTFNGPSQLVQMGSDGKLPAIDGSKLTNLPSSTPSNMMTTDTRQKIRASKQFDEGIVIYGANKELKVDGGGGFSLRLKQAGGTSYIISDGESYNTNKLILQGDNILCNRDAGTGAGSNLINIDSGNISDYLSTGGLKYWTGAETDYTAIETKDADTLYRTTDTNKVFLGTIQLGGNA